MSDPTPDHDRLVDEAIDLLIGLRNGPDSEASSERIRIWRARSPLHESIWGRVTKAHGASGKVLADQRRAERREGQRLTRRTLVIRGLAVLGGGTLAYTLGPDMLLQIRADHVTTNGEMRRIVLPGGDAVTLGPESAIALDYRTQRRNVNLLAGMCYCEVAGDTSGPFSVLAGPLTVTAQGTAFDVSRDAGFISVSVDHGVVHVQAQDAGLEAGEHVRQNQWMLFDPSSTTVQWGHRPPGQVASWRDNIIIAENEAVSALVARIGRWVPGRVVIADPWIGSRRVSGIFDTDDPLRALDAVVRPAGGNVRRISSFVTVISPI